MGKKALLTNLSRWRQQGDPPADKLVSEIVEKEGMAYIRPLMSYLSNFKLLDFKGQNEYFEKFYQENARLPMSYNKKEVIRATDFYLHHQQTIGMVLGCFSLPYCYLGEDGARVLTMSERIGKDTYNRLLETGHFLRKVMNYDHWQNNQLFDIVFKVRILHAIIRYFTLHSGKWDMAWGFPINQEDMAGTNLAFSLIVIRGLRKMGVPIDEQSERAYLVTWGYIGELLGVAPELLASSIKEAVVLDKAIAVRQFRASASGHSLTASLMECYTEMSGSQLASEFFQAQSRFLMGHQYADMLGIPKSRYPMSLLNAFNKSTSFLVDIYT